MKPKNVLIVGQRSGKLLEQIKEVLNTDEPTQISVLEPAVKELKHKKGKPTVIEYKGMRYVLDNR